MKCNRCGAELTDNAKFCGNCGNPCKIAEKTYCNVCGSELEINARFCGNCGAPLINNIPYVKKIEFLSDDVKTNPTKKQRKNYNRYILFIILILLILAIAIIFGFMLQKNNNKEISHGDTHISTQTPTPFIKASPKPSPSKPSPSNKPNSEYLFNSDTEYITVEYLDTKTQEETRLILNEMYARHGYMFTTDKYKSYFSSKSWYIPIYSSDVEAEKYFNDIERQNKNTITNFEKSKGWR